MILATYSDVLPADLVLTTDDFGKPWIAGATSPVFNLSHTSGVAFAAVALRGPLGIDAEIERGDVDWTEISRRYFAPAEAEENCRGPAGPAPACRLRMLDAERSLPEGYWHGLPSGTRHIPGDGSAK